MLDGVEEAVEARGARVYYLPPYSPDLNPIEQLFSKLKSLLRKASARTIKHLWKAISCILKQVSKYECAALFSELGLRST